MVGSWSSALSFVTKVGHTSRYVAYVRVSQRVPPPTRTHSCQGLPEPARFAVWPGGTRFMYVRYVGSSISVRMVGIGVRMCPPVQWPEHKPYTRSGEAGK